MKVIFLDVDGVLNDDKTLIEQKTQKAIKEEALNQLERIIKETEAEIVLSSTWRLLPDFFKHLENKLKQRNLNILDKTPVIIPDHMSMVVSRRKEIQKWLDECESEIEKFAIIDDDFDACIPGNFFQTDFFEIENNKTALTEEIANDVIMHLNG